ncbi:hypothetical protein GCM10020367_44020 [Streptomyces sannanensis]|uniref:Uncharacterized protein n=1 Tax=Streptomyces sannanensis TaxID=285536 RepID=A0ABP6SG15_9ACTN
MLLALDIVGVILLLQGVSPLVQKMAGKDPEESFFIVNQISGHQPLASVALIVLGSLLLTTSYRIRKSRK